MTTLQEAYDMIDRVLRNTLYDDDYAEHSAALDLLSSSALAQQGKQPVCHGCGIPAGDVHMSTCQSGKWPSRVSNGDTAAPAPQAQDKSDNYLSGYCTGRTDLLKEQSAQPVARPLTDAWIRERTKQPWVFDTVKQWVREIEAAHGIGRKPCS